MVLQHGLPLPLGVLALDAPERERQRSTTACVLPRDAQYELHSNLQMTFNSAWLGGAGERLFQTKTSCG